MQISLKQVQYFLAAAETGQFSAAANKVHVTQTAITAAIKSLEAALEVQLFERHHAAGVSLTADGQKFLHHAHAIAAAVHSAVQDPGLIRRDIGGTVRFGATHSMLGSYTVPALARFSRAYAHITLDIRERERPTLEQELLDGTLDIGVLWQANLSEPSRLQCVPLARSRRQLWLDAAHPLLQKRSIALSDVAVLPYVLYTMDETPRNTALFWERAGLSPDIRYRVSSIEALRSLVAQGMAVTVLSDVIYRPFSSEGLRIETRPVLDSMPAIEIALVWSAERPLSEAADAFRTFMQLSFGGPGSGVRVV